MDISLMSLFQKRASLGQKLIEESNTLIDYDSSGSLGCSSTRQAKFMNWRDEYG